jgi:hypothetical protein
VGSRFFISDRRGDQVKEWQCTRVNGKQVGKEPVPIPNGATLSIAEWVKVTFDLIPESLARLTVQGVCNPGSPEDTSRVYLLLGDSITLGGEPWCGILIEGSHDRAVKLIRRGDRTFFEMTLDKGDVSSAVLRAVCPGLELKLEGQSFKVEPYASIP